MSEIDEYELAELERYRLELLEDIEEAGRRSMVALRELQALVFRLRSFSRRARFAACIARSAEGYNLGEALSLLRALRPAIEELERVTIPAAVAAREAAEAELDDLVDLGESFLNNLPA